MSTTEPKSVFDMILAWSASRPIWQQDALRRIVAKGALSPEDISDLVQLCKKAKGAPDIEIEGESLAPEHVPAKGGRAASVSLASITNVTGVNRLASGQELPFEARGITVIYGDNGVGKSGYARILKRACNARFPGSIEPNAFDPAAVRGAAATIKYTSGHAPANPIAWSDNGAVHLVLSSVSVFDRDSGAVHIRKPNEVAFRPFGLDIPDELATACIAVKDTLTSEQSALNRNQDILFTNPTWSPGTAVGKVLGALKSSTKLEPLKALTVMSPEEQGRLQRLNEDLMRNPLQASAEASALADSLNRLADGIETVLALVSDAALSQLVSLAEGARTKRAAATMAAESAFARAALPGVGENTWRALWDAARRYSDAVVYPEMSFPATAPDALCVLCHQPMSDAASQRMGDFEAFIKADTEQHAQQAEAAFKTAFDALKDKPVRILAFPLRRQLAVNHPGTAASILRCLAAARLRRAHVLASVMVSQAFHASAVPTDPTGDIRQLAAGAALYAAELAAAADAEGRARLEHDRDELRDRAALAILLPKAEAEVARLSSLALLKTCLAETTTNAITNLGTAIADVLALLWQIGFDGICEELLTMRASHWWWSREEVEDGLPDGRHARLGRRSPGSFFFAPLL